MATIKVLGRYRSSFGSFEVGQVLELPDEDAGWLLRDSPGSFRLVGSAEQTPDPPGPASIDDEEDGEDDDFDPTGAMSTQTASGLVVPDRRGRGGRRRSE